MLTEQYSFNRASRQTGASFLSQSRYKPIQLSISPRASVNGLHFRLLLTNFLRGAEKSGFGRGRGEGKEGPPQRKHGRYTPNTPPPPPPPLIENQRMSWCWRTDRSRNSSARSVLHFHSNFEQFDLNARERRRFVIHPDGRGRGCQDDPSDLSHERRQRKELPSGHDWIGPAI